MNEYPGKKGSIGKWYNLFWKPLVGVTHIMCVRSAILCMLQSWGFLLGVALMMGITLLFVQAENYSGSREDWRGVFSQDYDHEGRGIIHNNNFWFITTKEFMVSMSNQIIEDAVARVKENCSMENIKYLAETIKKYRPESAEIKNGKSL